MSALSQVLWILQKDLLIEWRARSRLFALISFALTTLLLFSFAVGPDTKTLRDHAGGYLWLALLFSSTALLDRSLRVEEESGAMDSLLLAPTSPTAIFYGKAISNSLQLIMLGLIALPVTLALCDATLTGSPLVLLAALVLGSMGLAAPGTLYAALTARISGQQLLLPLIVPALLAAVKATTLVLTGDPMEQSGSWLVLLGCFDALYWSVCGILFGRIVET